MAKTFYLTDPIWTKKIYSKTRGEVNNLFFYNILLIFEEVYEYSCCIHNQAEYMMQYY